MPKNRLFFVIMLLFIFIFTYSKVTAALEVVNDLYYSGQYEQALERMVERESSFLEKIGSEKYYLNLAYLYYENGMLDHYVNTLEKSYQASGKQPGLALKTAVGHYTAGSYDRAEEFFTRLAGTDLEHLSGIEQRRFFFYRGSNARAAGNLSQAEDYWQQGREHQPTYAGFDVELARLAEIQNNYEQALTYYQSALSKDSSISYVLPQMAEAAEHIGDYEQAWSYWQRSYESGISRERAARETERLQKMLPEKEPEPEPITEIEPAPDWEPDWKSYDLLDEDPGLLTLEVGVGQQKSRQLFQVDAPFRIINEQGLVILTYGEPYTEWELKRLESGEFQLKRAGESLAVFSGAYDLEIIPLEDRASIMLHNIAYGSGYFFAGREDRQYRGRMRIQVEDGRQFRTINRVNIQEYLVSVVPSEMPASWPMEALKAQTLAARSFTIRNLGRRQARYGFDLLDTVSDAAYSGINSEHPRTTEAVKATRGEVGVHGGRVIDAVFSSNSGGHTEDSVYVWGGEVPYLQGVNLIKGDSSIEFPLLPAGLIEWHQSSPETHSGPGSYSYEHAYRWMREVDLELLAERLDLSRVIDFRIKERSPGGYVQEIAVKGPEEVATIRGGVIRSTLGGVRSSSFSALRKYDEQGFLRQLILYGAGWGHGVGMDQTAAARMAGEGYSYREIFTTFYTGTEIETRY